MSEPEHARAHAGPPRPTWLSRLPRWGLLAGVAFAASGALLVTSSINAQGSDLRSASVTDLDTVVRSQRQDTDALQKRVAQLNSEVNALSRRVDDEQVAELQKQIDAVRGPAGLAPVSGAGLRVTLSDAPQDLLDQAIKDGKPAPTTLIVHQQDIQAAVNALWLGGARGISIMGQRIISTTGIKCAGPTVILHGVPYSPPYVIDAVGDPGELQAALDRSDYIDAYRVVADRYGLTYDVAHQDTVDLRAYEGTTELRYAKPLTTS